MRLLIILLNRIQTWVLFFKILNKIIVYLIIIIIYKWNKIFKKMNKRKARKMKFKLKIIIFIKKIRF